MSIPFPSKLTALDPHVVDELLQYALVEAFVATTHERIHPSLKVRFENLSPDAQIYADFIQEQGTDLREVVRPALKFTYTALGSQESTVQLIADEELKMRTFSYADAWGLRLVLRDWDVWVRHARELGVKNDASPRLWYANCNPAINMVSALESAVTKNPGSPVQFPEGVFAPFEEVEHVGQWLTFNLARLNLSKHAARLTFRHGKLSLFLLMRFYAQLAPKPK